MFVKRELEGIIRIFDFVESIVGNFMLYIKLLEDWYFD